MRLYHLVRAGVRVLWREGPRSFAGRMRGRLSAPVEGAHAPRVVSMVKREDAVRVDWTRPPEQLLHPKPAGEGPLTIAWVMSPPSPNSGGHQNLFRFIDYAEKAGHRCQIYFYTNTPIVVNPIDMKAMLKASSGFPDLQASMSMYTSTKGVDSSVDAIFATSWETAYPVFLDNSRARRFYFVQDFEPAFYPVGSESMLAENTYRFGFHGLTAGGWLSEKLSSEYGMPADHYDFAVDRDRYSVVNTGARSEIFFYARPSTPRRGFELGVLALQEFAARRPDVTINMAGEDVSAFDLPFEFRNLAGMDVSRLNDVYNRCAAGLVISATNMSLLPLELMSSGVTPVVNDAPNNRLVSDNPFIEYVPASAGAIADRLVDVLDRTDAQERSLAMSRSLSELSWDDSGRQFVSAFERAMRG